MTEREKVIKGLECCLKDDCDNCPYYDPEVDHDCDYFGKCLRGNMYHDALALLKAQEARHRLEVHNIGNVDIPEGVTWEQFQAVMDGVVSALEHTDRGESWPYDEVKREAAAWQS